MTARLVRGLATILVFIILGGCANHPLTENYTGYSTVDIVEHIRCEARRSIQDNAIGLLRAIGDNDLADELANHRDQFPHFNESRLKTQEERNFYRRYIDTGLALDFKFDIVESNSATSQVDLVKLLTNGTFSMALTASGSLSRQSTREFIVTDKFRNLLDDPKVCRPGDDYLHQPNLSYPISGKIGLDEVIGTFIRLNEDGILFKKKDEKAPVFSDQLMYTTSVSGSIAPKITLTPMGRRFQLMDASLTNTASRSDINRVLVGLSLEPTKPNRGTRGVVGAPFAAAFGSFATVFAKRNVSEAEVRAVQAITQARINSFFDNFSSGLVVRERF